jgi:hypothetical protein
MWHRTRSCEEEVIHGGYASPYAPLTTSSCVVWCEMDELHLHFDALHQLVKLTILLRKHVDDFAHLQPEILDN